MDMWYCRRDDDELHGDSTMSASFRKRAHAADSLSSCCQS